MALRIATLLVTARMVDVHNVQFTDYLFGLLRDRTTKDGDIPAIFALLLGSACLKCPCYALTV